MCQYVAVAARSGAEYGNAEALQAVEDLAFFSRLLKEKVIDANAC